jgi:hypothetical protein
MHTVRGVPILRLFTELERVCRTSTLVRWAELDVGLTGWTDRVTGGPLVVTCCRASDGTLQAHEAIIVWHRGLVARREQPRTVAIRGNLAAPRHCPQDRPCRHRARLPPNVRGSVWIVGCSPVLPQHHRRAACCYHSPS